LYNIEKEKMRFLDTAFNTETEDNFKVIRYLDLDKVKNEKLEDNSQWGTKEIGVREYPEISLRVFEKFVSLSLFSVSSRINTNQSKDIMDLHGVNINDMMGSVLKNESFLTKQKNLYSVYKGLAEKPENDISNGSRWRSFIKRIFPKIKFPVYLGKDPVDNSKILIKNIFLQSNLIASRSRRGYGDFLICNSSVGALIQDHPSFIFSERNGLITNPGEIYYAGNIGNKIAVFIDPNKSFKDKEVLIGRVTKEGEPGVYIVENKKSQLLDEFLDPLTLEKNIRLLERLAFIDVGNPSQNFTRFEVEFSNKPLWKKILCI
jgi:hypothetical protein